MVKFIRHTIFFLLPFICVFVIIEILYSRVPNEYSVKSADLQNQLYGAKGVILGPSLTQKGVDPNKIELKVYNMSLKGMDLPIRKRMLKTVIESCPNIQYAIISISYVDLHHMTEYQNPSALVNYEKYFWSSGIKTYLAQNRGATMLKKIYKHYIKKGELRAGLDSLGFKINLRPDVQNLRQKAIELSPSIINPNPHFVKRNLEVINEIHELCTLNGIDLIFITTPIHSTMTTQFDKSQADMTFGTIRSMDSLFTNLYYFDFMSDTSFTDNKFQDPIHLNASGTDHLSTLFDQRLKEIVK